MAPLFLARHLAPWAVGWCIMHAPSTEKKLEPPGPIRIVEETCVHFMIRPNTDGTGVVATAQLTVCTPW